MKIKENFVLKTIAGANVVLPLGDATVDFTGLLSLNESGVFLWHLLEKGSTREELATALTREYDVSFETALIDVDGFIAKLNLAKCLDM